MRKVSLHAGAPHHYYSPSPSLAITILSTKLAAYSALSGSPPTPALPHPSVTHLHPHVLSKLPRTWALPSTSSPRMFIILSI